MFLENLFRGAGRIWYFQEPCVTFRNMWVFYGWEFLASLTNPVRGRPPQSANRLLSVFWGCDVPWWQGAHFLLFKAFWLYGFMKFGVYANASSVTNTYGSVSSVQGRCEGSGIPSWWITLAHHCNILCSYSTRDLRVWASEQQRVFHR
jgi:hypothetical protein